MDIATMNDEELKSALLTIQMQRDALREKAREIVREIERRAALVRLENMSTAEREALALALDAMRAQQ